MEINNYKDLCEYPFDALAASDPNEPLVLDTETAGHTSDSHFVIYFSWASNDGVLNGAGPTTTIDGFNFFKAILDSPRPKVFHNITADLDFIRNSSMECSGKRGYCTLLAHSLLDEYHGTHALDHLNTLYNKRHRSDIVELEYYKKGVPAAKKNLYVPQSVMHRYAHQDAIDTLGLMNIFWAKLKEQGLWDLYEETMDAEMAWYQMELDGIEFDVEVAEQSLERINPLREILEEEIHEAFGEKFLITSGQQLGKVLAKHFTLTKKTKTGWCTDKETLKSLSHDSRVQLVVAFRKLSQCGSKIRNRVEEGSNRLYPEFRQTLVTGRSSCSGTPLHQIPKRAGRVSIADVGSEVLAKACSEAYKSLRRMWIPTPGATLVTFDYDQAEYRAAGHYTGSERLITLLKDGGDFHEITANLVFGECTPTLRDITKFINFGLLYGMGLEGLENLIRGLVTEAPSSILQRYERELPEMRAFQQEVLKVYKSRGYVVDVFGRRYRAIPSWFKRLHQTDDYAIINYLCQGTVGNLKRYAIARIHTKIMMPMIHDKLREHRSKLVTEVHDELVFEIFPEDADILYDIHREMTDFPQFKVPFTTAPNVGRNLLEVKEMTLDEAVSACKTGMFVG